MKEPNIEELLRKIPSKYTLVLVTAKRARQLMDMPDLDFEHGEKAIIRAMEEVAAGEVRFVSSVPR